MFGIFIGTVSLIGLIAVLRRGRHHRFGRGLGGVIRDLDLTPEQEQEFAQASSRLRDAGWDLFGATRELRKGLANAVASQDSDQRELDRQFDLVGERLHAVRVTIAAELETLRKNTNENQRRKLSSWLLASGLSFLHFRGRHCGGPSGHRACCA